MDVLRQDKSIIELKTAQCTEKHLDYLLSGKSAYREDDKKMRKKLNVLLKNPDIAAYCLEDPTTIKLGMDDEYFSREMMITGTWCDLKACPDFAD